MLIGEKVTVWKKSDSETFDPFGAPIEVTECVEVDNVLIEPVNASELVDTNRPFGDVLAYVLHFPKTFTDSLRGAYVEFDNVKYDVVGDPKSYRDSMTPGTWNRRVEVIAYVG